MNIRNLITALKYQLPLKRFFKNFFITKNGWGMFHRNSHISQKTNKPKISYKSYESALKAAKIMEFKTRKHFSVYKCVFCDGFHLGKNRNNK